MARMVDVTLAAASEESLDRDEFLLELLLDDLAEEPLAHTSLGVLAVAREVTLYTVINDRLRDKAVAWAMFKADHNGQEISDALGGILPHEVLGLLLGVDQVNG